MHDTLKQFWRGNQLPCDRTVKKNSTYHKLALKQIDLIDSLSSRLSDDDRKCLDEILELSNQMNSIDEEETFITSFQLGARFMMAILTDYDGQFHT